MVIVKHICMYKATTSNMSIVEKASFISAKWYQTEAYSKDYDSFEPIIILSSQSWRQNFTDSLQNKLESI